MYKRILVLLGGFPWDSISTYTTACPGIWHWNYSAAGYIRTYQGILGSHLAPFPTKRNPKNTNQDQSLLEENVRKTGEGRASSFLFDSPGRYLGGGPGGGKGYANRPDSHVHPWAAFSSWEVL